MTKTDFKIMLWISSLFGVTFDDVDMDNVDYDASIQAFYDAFEDLIILVDGDLVGTYKAKYPTVALNITTSKSNGHTTSADIALDIYTRTFTSLFTSAVTLGINYISTIKVVKKTWKLMKEFYNAIGKGDVIYQIVTYSSFQSSFTIPELYELLMDTPTYSSLTGSIKQNIDRRMALIKFGIDNGVKVNLYDLHFTADYLNSLATNITTRDGKIVIYPTTGATITLYYNPTTLVVNTTGGSGFVSITAYVYDNTKTIDHVSMTANMYSGTIKAYDSSNNEITCATIIPYTPNGFLLQTNDITVDTSVNPLADNWYRNTTAWGVFVSGYDGIFALLSRVSYGDYSMWNQNTISQSMITNGYIELLEIMKNSQVGSSPYVNALINPDYQSAYTSGEVDVISENNYIDNVNGDISGDTEITIPSNYEDLLQSVYNGTADILDIASDNSMYPSAIANPFEAGNGTIIGTSNTVNSVISGGQSGISSAITGANSFVTLWYGNTDLINNLASFLWSETFSSAIINVLANPAEAIINLIYMPIVPYTNSYSQVKLGNVSTGVSMYKVADGYYELDCGYISIGTPNDTLDLGYRWYHPYSKYELYLPFIGMVSLDPLYINYRIRVKYTIDMMSGTAVCNIYSCTTNDFTKETLIYTYSTNIAKPIPITNQNYGQLFGSLIKGSVDLAVTAATGGAAAGLLIGDVVDAATSIIPDVNHSNGIGGNAGLMGVLTPYLMITRTVLNNSDDYVHIHGKACHFSVALNEMNGTGYCRFQNITTNPSYPYGSQLTASEIDELINLLESGVYM